MRMKHWLTGGVGSAQESRRRSEPPRRSPGSAGLDLTRSGLPAAPHSYLSESPAGDATAPSSPPAALAVGAAAILLLVTAISLLELHGFDFALIRLSNSVSTKSPILDYGVGVLSKEMFSNLLMVSLIWFAWFSSDEARDRSGLLVGTVVSYAAGAISRVLQLTLPTHPRPLQTPALSFLPPIGVDPNRLSHWGSFPGDHAAVFFGLATTVFIVSRPLGRLAFALALVLGCARIYLGFHYPSDIIAGAALGIVLVSTSTRLNRSSVVLRLLATEQSHRSWFYAVSFYVCFGIATLFNDYRDTAVLAAHMLKAHLPH